MESFRYNGCGVLLVDKVDNEVQMHEFPFRNQEF